MESRENVSTLNLILNSDSYAVGQADLPAMENQESSDRNRQLDFTEVTQKSLENCETRSLENVDDNNFYRVELSECQSTSSVHSFDTDVTEAAVPMFNTDTEASAFEKYKSSTAGTQELGTHHREIPVQCNLNSVPRLSDTFELALDTNSSESTYGIQINQGDDNASAATAPITVFSDTWRENAEAAVLNPVTCHKGHRYQHSKDQERFNIIHTNENVSVDETMNNQLLKLEQNEISNEKNMNVFCDVCADAANKDDFNTTIPTAIWKCVDCTENQCDDCNRAHRRQKGFRNHEIVKIDEYVERNRRDQQQSKEPKKIEIPCSVCKENNEDESDDTDVPEATVYCIDCCENQCSSCSKDHLKQRLFKGHTIVILDNQLKEKLVEIREMILTCDVCEANSEENVELAIYYCVTCDERQCERCSRAHKRQLIFKSHQTTAVDDKFKLKLLEEKKARKQKTELPCDVCMANAEDGDINAVPFALLRCTDCCENQCASCNEDHKRQKLFKTHTTIDLDNQLKEKLVQIREMIVTCDVCEANSDGDKKDVGVAINYCVTCDERQCIKCSRAHKRQMQFKSHQTVAVDDKFKLKLLEEQNAKLSEDSLLEFFCDVCKANGEDKNENSVGLPVATLHCTDCNENQCDSCSREHKRQKPSKNHNILELNRELKEKLKSMKATCDVCSVNNDNGKTNLPAATKYCENCQEKQCDQCSEERKRLGLCKDHIIVPLNKMKNTVKDGTSGDKQTTKACDQCAENLNNTELTAIPPATMYCIDCSEFQCTECSRVHIRQSPCKEHKIITIEEQLSREAKDNARTGSLTCTFDNTSEREQGESSPNKLDFNYIIQSNQLTWLSTTPLLKDKEYSRIQQLLEKPRIAEDNLENVWKCALPYIIQHIKMWNGNVLTAQNLNSLIARPKAMKGLVDVTKSCPVSRLDFLTYIINAADFVVAQDILRILSKFPVAIPLIVRDIKDCTKHIVTIPLIQNVVTKWESSPGNIAENYLFSSQFRLIVAVRLGSSRMGKSAILNQLMKKQFMFSSSGEAGSRYGRPRTLDGSVEIVWLTQETCSDITWKTILMDYYKENTEEIAILANLHGDALQYENTLQFLLRLSCSFIVFLMPGFSKNQWVELKKYLISKIIVCVLVDPEENFDDPSTQKINTATLSTDETQETMRCLLHESFGLQLYLKPPGLNFAGDLGNSLKYMENLNCENSGKIVKIVKQHGCFNIRRMLGRVSSEQHAQWDPLLKTLIKLFMAILNSSEQVAKHSLTYLETSLSQLSGKESKSIRTEVRQANEQVRRIVKTPTKAAKEHSKQDHELKEAQDKLKAVMEKAENINLGQEHFFRVMGQLYETGINDKVLKAAYSTDALPKCFANLLINGHAIELLNGDSGEMQLPWMKAVCDCVSQILPNFRVFVISIIGLQSSGKSTLLNALFSCRFAVSVGRCSRGLFMRMILLDEELRKTCGCDGIILIDTEGLCSPEKLNDPKASQKDRLMATYAMGVSNLTIVNILGEGMTEMTEILQIAIVAMARLRGGGIRPDILMVQHLQERNVARIDQAKGQFCEAVNKAFDLIMKNDVEIGSASAECLAELTARIQSGDLFQHFGPFRDGSSVNSPPSETYHADIVGLFNTLLQRAKASEKKKTFERWSNHFESYWSCVQEENFALNFKNIKHITDFLYFRKKIAKVKELLESAIRRHRDIFSAQIREAINSHIESKGKVPTEDLNRKLLTSIKQQLQLIPHSCPSHCQACKEFGSHHEALLQELSDTEWEEDTKRSLKAYNEKLIELANKVVKQTFDGSVVRQGCLSNFSEVIVKELKEALDLKPSGIYTTEEQSQIRDRIWEYLTAVAHSSDSGTDFDTKFFQALNHEYVVSGIQTNIVKDFYTEINCEDLFSANAVRPMAWYRQLAQAIKHLEPYGPLSKKQRDFLSNSVDGLLMNVFQSRGEDYSRTGLDFEEGMVAKIRLSFPNQIKRFEERFCVHLQGDFKMSLQIYVLQQFKREMNKLQMTWNKQNRPSEILIEKKNEYIAEIETRLKTGFSCAGEGEVVAMKLWKSLNKSAIKAVYDKTVEDVKSLEWTTNSEKVRLLYFEQLALEVESGKKTRALEHFENPKRAIEDWYKNKVNSFRSQAKLKEIHRAAILTEFGCIQTKVSKATTKKDIDRILQEHIRNVDDQYYSKIDPKDDDFGPFRNSVAHHLQSQLETELNKSYSLPLVSDNLDVQRRLGCTEHCYWCGALCWGARDHQVLKDSNPEMECHHSCHQPQGLEGTHDRDSKKLTSESCHHESDTTIVFFKEFLDGDGILWGDAKRDHFADWKFDAHCITTFDELMKWFFYKLHRDIAYRNGLHPADWNDLNKSKFDKLRLDSILKVVRSKI